jgi:photosystem II stability/assembly factor-like uncharacterized protein
MKRFFLLAVLVAAIFQVAFSQWQSVNGPYGGTINDLVLKGQNVFALTNQQGLFCSTDNAATWIRRSSGIACNYALCSTVKGNTLYIGTSYGLYSSANDGLTWNTVLVNGSVGTFVRSICSNTQSLYILEESNMKNIYKSDDDGATWIQLFSGDYASGLAVQGNSVFFAGQIMGDVNLYRSLDNGASFGTIPYSNVYPYSLLIDGTTLYATNYDGEIYKSADNGDTWNPSSTGIVNPTVMNITMFGNTIYAACYFGQYYYSAPPGDGGIYMSQDGGAHWTNLGLQGYTVQTVTVSGSRIIAGTHSDGVFISDNSGATWSPSNQDLARLPIGTVSCIGNEIFTSNNSTFYGFSGFSNTISVSTDGGTNWADADSGMSYPLANCFVDGGSFILAGGDAVYKSTDHGASWHSVFSPGCAINCVFISGTRILAGTNSNGVFVSDDQGVTWHSANNGLDNYNIMSILNKDNLLFAGTGYSVFKSVDNGTTWIPARKDIEPYYIASMTASDNYLFASGWATRSGIFRSPDDGNTWYKSMDLLPGNSQIATLAASGNVVIAGTTDQVDEILYSDDEGFTWSVANLGLPGGFPVPGLAIHDSTVYAGLVDYFNNPYGEGLWKRALSDFVPFKLENDTVLMKETSGDLKILGITSETPWIINGTLPAWLNVNKNSGSGTDNLYFTTVQENTGQSPRYASFDIVSEGIPRHCVIIQQQKQNGIGNIPITGKIRIYPNPASDIISLDIPSGSGENSVQILDGQGSVILERKIEPNGNRINICLLKPGLYFLKIINDRGQSCGKFVKE